METQDKWSTSKQEAYGVYYAITKWNYYLQDSDIIMCNDNKPLQKFLNEKNTNNKVDHWSLEIATYNITLEWISGAHNKASDCLSRLVEVPECNAQVTSILIHAVTVSPADRPATHTKNKTKALIEVPPTDAFKVNAPPHLIRDCGDSLLQMQQTVPF